ncbi:MAG: carboxypeptidase regulatory-like domain-containing protein [Bacteroidetes bacterium]|nr:carboxypeptidase regulatory-like domain-containing protein [Bacteroidota bacterium]
MKSLFRLLLVLWICAGSITLAQNTRTFLQIDPSGTVGTILTINPGQNVQFTARAYEFTAAGTKVEIPITSIVWAVDPASFGTITPQGLFTAAAQNSASPRGVITATAVAGNMTLTSSVAVMLSPQGGHIRGSVMAHSAQVTPLPGTQVTAIPRSGTNPPSNTVGYHAWTDAQGNYDIIGLPDGAYTVYANKSGYVIQYFDGKADAASSDAVTIASAGTVTDVDFSLDVIPPTPLYSISGTVRDNNGNPIAGAIVTAWVNGRPSTNAACIGYGHATSAADGSYLIAGLPQGDFIVRAQAAGFIAEYYSGATDMKLATPVTVTNQPVTGIDFSLDPGGSISGTVSNEDTNAPLANATVIVRSVQNRFERGARTNAQGQYTIAGLPADAYTIFTSAFRFIGEYYDNATTATQAGTVTLTASANVTGIDFALTPAPTAPRLYRGSVVARNARNGLLTVVEAINPSNGMVLSTGTDAQGTFEFQAWDNAVLRARALGYVGVYAGGTMNWKESRWEGAIGEMTFSLNPVAENGLALLTGSVKDNTSGAALDNAWVYGMDAAGNTYFTVSGADGGFSIPNTANGNLDLMISEVGFETGSLSTEISDAKGSATISAQRSSTTAVTNPVVRPSSPTLYQNYPNPFNPATVISYALPERMHVSIRIHDLLGREVGLLVNDVMDAGNHNVTWDASQLPSGIYMCRLEAAGDVVVRRMTLMK